MRINTIIFYLSIILNILTIFRIVKVEISYVNIPKTLRIIHYIMYIGYFGLIIYSSFQHQTNISSNIFLCIEYLFNLFFIILCVVLSMRMDNINTSYNKNKYKYMYRNITAKQFAKQIGLEYISNVEETLLDEKKNDWYLPKKNYIPFTPLNNGQKSLTKIWYVNSSEPYIEDFLTNEDGFKGIINLDEILLEMLKLYRETINKDIFINCFGFAIKLEDEINLQESYRGKGKLVITDNGIINGKVKFQEKLEKKKQCLNDFIDKFITLNFGKEIRKNPILKHNLDEFNQDLIKKGLRQHTHIRKKNNTFNEDVQEYSFKEQKEKEIIE